MKSSCRNVLEFYDLITILKERIRTGWLDWNVNLSRLESVAEHSYSVCMLAIGMDSEFSYEIDLRKVILMLVIHELEECVIGDITPFEGVSREKKMEMGHQAIENILFPLCKGNEYRELILEFDERVSKEAKFAYMCDKLDADLMAISYNQKIRTLYTNAGEKLKQNKEVEKWREIHPECVDIADFFVNWDMQTVAYDSNFREVLEAAYLSYNKME